MQPILYIHDTSTRIKLTHNQHCYTLQLVTYYIQMKTGEILLKKFQKFLLKL